VQEDAARWRDLTDELTPEQVADLERQERDSATRAYRQSQTRPWPHAYCSPGDPRGIYGPTAAPILRPELVRIDSRVRIYSHARVAPGAGARQRKTSGHRPSTDGSTVMAYYHQHTGTVCQYGHAEESRRGPSCWRTDCPAHTQWLLREGRAS
jgi:hypothetical protein